MAVICIYGAGSIGCYLGGRLAATGAEVVFIGRQRLRDTLAGHGLRVSDYHGVDLRLPPEVIRYSSVAADAARADLVLVCVKSAASEQAAAELAGVLRPGTLVLSCQNGLGNAAILQRGLPQQRVLAAMVPFNVANRGDGHFHQGSEGELMVAADPALAPFLPLFVEAGLPWRQMPDMPAVLWAKLLLNLNNPVNALSGLPLKTELSQRAFRRCLALAQREALGLMREANIRPARLTPLPPALLARLLTVPDWLFARLAQRMLAMDPLARSSMWEDLEAGRRTEIDWINGEVAQLARQLGRRAPVNERLIALVRAAETGGRRDWSGDELLAELLP